MKVTILMPVYNSVAYLSASIDSILNQTYTDFELVIIDDGSSDNSEAIIATYNDFRIRLITLERNRGIVYALNLGLSEARGEFIVRMDADDISFPHRIEKQVEFMDRNPDIGVSGSSVEYFGRKTGIMKAPASHQEIVWSMLFGSPFFHPTVILRKDVLVSLGLNQYPSDYPHAEDFALWAALLGKTHFANLQEVLLRYRINAESVSSRHKEVQKEMSLRIRRNVHSKLRGNLMSDEDWKAISLVNSKRVNISLVHRIYKEINDRNKLLSERQFRIRISMLIKQLVLKRGADFASYGWMLKQLPRDISFLKYMLFSLTKNFI